MKAAICAAVLAAIFTGSANAADTVTVSMTRREATAALNALAAIGEPYKVTVKQAGQDVPVPKFLDVSPAMRSTLVRDTVILHGILVETAKLEEDAKQRLGSDAAALERENNAISETKISVEGLILFAEADLQLDKNPQITLVQASALAVLETPR